MNNKEEKYILSLIEEAREALVMKDNGVITESDYKEKLKQIRKKLGFNE